MQRYQVLDQIKEQVMIQTSRLALNNRLEEEIDSLPYQIINRDRPLHRCCVYHERAVVGERVRLALGLDPSRGGTPQRLSELIARARGQKQPRGPVIAVIDSACDACPIDRFTVTNACRNCMAHACRDVCPRQAIVVAEGRALIDQSRCVECGRCAAACPFHAIVEVIRPCIRACSIGAIKVQPNRKARIDYRSCVGCGHCITACPYGAIAEKSFLLPVIAMLQAGTPVYAVLAPSFVGQFGPRVTPGKLREALKQLGFAEVVEAAQGADLVTVEEAREFLDQPPEARKLRMNRCCYGFHQLVCRHHPELAEYQFKSASPMVRCGQLIKQSCPKSRVVFVGPCIAKKTEALQQPARKYVDAVLTFDELKALFKAAEIDPSTLKGKEEVQDASSAGRAFARAGGVSQALVEIIKRLDPEAEVTVERAEGLADCERLLKAVAAGRLKADLLEGMACPGGCLGGPATSLKPAVAGRLVEDFCRSALYPSSLDHPLCSPAAEVR